MKNRKYPKNKKSTLDHKALKNKAEKYWIYGYHAVIEALKNQNRKIELLCFSDRYGQDAHLKNILSQRSINHKQKDQQWFAKQFPDDAVHQSIVCLVHYLPIQYEPQYLGDKRIVILDQVSDPRNIGAIMRSAAAFNWDAIIIPKHNSPVESSVMAKAASGALEHVSIIRATNISQMMEELKRHDFWCVGMDGYADNNIADCKSYEKIALIMGAEGKGLRQKTKKYCDLTVKLPISEKMESLNVATASAIAMYAFSL